MNILVLNRGSSTIKCDFYRFWVLPTDPIAPLWSGLLEWKSSCSDMKLKIEKDAISHTETRVFNSPEEALPYLFSFLIKADMGVLGSLGEIDVIGHRVVLGGKEFQSSTFINPLVKEQIRKLSPLAPLHNPMQLRGIEISEKIFPNKPQVAVFDTAFHHTLPLEAKIYPIPYKYFEEGIQRFGFHGISFQYCFKRTLKLVGEEALKQKIVICHLGSGASLCAVKEGQSIDTTMGFTPLEGLMMDTRCGSIDPGLICHLLQHSQESIESLSQMLYHSSGLLGVSGISCDMRDILEQKKQGSERAELAFNVYLQVLNRHIGSMIASLKGLDILVFTAGIGENASELRQRVCDSFAFLNIQIDTQKNLEASSEDHLISTKNSSVKVLLVHTKESFEISSECFNLIKN